MKVAILGFGSQGASSLEYYRAQGHDVTVHDRDLHLPTPDGAMVKLGDDYLENLQSYDVIIRSPSIYPADIVKANGETILAKVTTNTNEFMRICPTRQIIGVTGTKGKGTTSTLITKILEAQGKRVHLGGNIGTPPLEMLKNNIKPDDWVVLELANFQLIDLKYSPPIAVCLMIAADHLDWHGDIDNYMQAKQQLFRWQTPEDIAVFYSKNEDSKRIASQGQGKKVPYFSPPGACIVDNHIVIEGQTICSTGEIALPGEHNWQNVCAAVTAVWQISQDVTAMRKAITEFKGLPFRIELRRELNGVKFYNDSFASGPGATLALLEAIKEPKVMILGGFDRGLDLSELADSLIAHKDNVRKAILIGASAGRLAEVLKSRGFDNFAVNPAKDIRPIVQAAYREASRGDAVVLSPAFPSFDMFKNFEDRGTRYNEAVEALV